MMASSARSQPMYVRVMLLVTLTLNLPQPSTGGKLAWATFYGNAGGARMGGDKSGMNPNKGACGFGNLKNGADKFYTAVNDLAPDFNMNCYPNPNGQGNPVCDGAACGQCLAVQCVSKMMNYELFTVKEDGFDGQTVCKNASSENRERVAVVMITDACPSDHPNNKAKGAANKCGRKYNALDISWDAFNGIADVAVGQVHVRMEQVDCSRVSLGLFEVAKNGGSLVQKLNNGGSYGGVRSQGLPSGRKLLMSSGYNSTQFVGTNPTIISVD